jgi:hypothetical protein
VSDPIRHTAAAQSRSLIRSLVLDPALLFGRALFPEALVVVVFPEAGRSNGGIFPPLTTVATLLYPVLSDDPSHRGAVARLLARRAARGLPPCLPDTDVDCKARHRPPGSLLPRLVRGGIPARLWGKALAADPGLAEDRKSGHRCNAACAAALAGCGQGPARARARVWLAAELAAWLKLIRSGTPWDRKTVVQTLRHWQGDADLAGVRDEAKYGTLPFAELEAWLGLWAEFGALLQKAKTR